MAFTMWGEDKAISLRKPRLRARQRAAYQAAVSRSVRRLETMHVHLLLCPGLQSLAAILSLCRVLSDRGGSDLRAQAGAPKQELSSALWLLLR